MVTIPRSPRDVGAPRLSWPGRAESPFEVEARTPVLRERWGDGEVQGRVLLGDNRELLAGLSPGSVRLCYLDPPFFSGQRYLHRARVGEETYEVTGFSDRWEGGLPAYLSFLEERLRLIARALADDGSLYVHLDPTASHYVKVLLDEILGATCFSREVVWRIGWISGFKSTAKNWIRNHDVLLYYARPGAYFKRILLPHPEGYERRAGKKGEGRPIDDVWTDIQSIQLKSFSTEKTGYSTQKNEELLARIVEASSEPGDLVLDPFCGAGTTAVAAAAAGRSFVVMDALPLATHLTRVRLAEAGVTFTVEGDEPPVAGRVEAEASWTLAGPTVTLKNVASAAGPEHVAALERVDAWWLHCAAAPEQAVWYAHRHSGRHPDPVPTVSAPLNVPAGTELLVEAVDLAGARHRGTVRVPDHRS